MVACCAETDLMPLAAAMAQILPTCQPIPAVVRCPLQAAHGGYLAAPVHSQCDLPVFDNAAMDGYAVADDAKRQFRLVGRVAAGQWPDKTLAAGEAVRIFTGAPVPRGTHAVVMQEHATQIDDMVIVDAAAPLSAGQFMRRAGEDVRAGAEILPKGQPISERALMLAAAAGHDTLLVYDKLRVGVFSTGDEVVDPGHPLAPGQIYGCNRQGVLAAGQKLGFEMVDLGHMPDDPQVIAAGLQAAAVQCDVLLTSGGVSVGEEDHVRPVVQAHGDLLFWRLAIKPGKPIAIGHVFGRPFIGLPGNPVSSMITFQLIAAPILRAYAGGGAAQWQPQAFAMMAGADIRKAPGRQEFQRAFLRETGDGLRVFTTPTNGQIGGSTLQASHMLAALAAADGVIDLAADCAGVAAGEIVPFIPFA